MSDVVIKVENLSKQYRLGELGTGTLSHDLNRWWHRIRGKEDPYLKIGETNDRSTKGNSDYVWALRDINFEVKQGEVLGIIGKNGAGKSTLLKLLSRVTAPTTGSIKAKGRIASLLEVGTGFHEELTGRENIFLNGAILGMTKAEIRAKFDEIVAFSGTERYIDTPVKRYSSGMRVRLAFAVAAHLDPEILIVDEVLAVGDAEFQKKAIGKMQDISKEQGRTVLFVSHNMATISKLCKYGLVLKNGTIDVVGHVNDCVEKYYSSTGEVNLKGELIVNRSGNGRVKLRAIKVYSSISEHIVSIGSDLIIELIFDSLIKYNTNDIRIDLRIDNHIGVRVAWLSTELMPITINSNRINFIVPSCPLNFGLYYITTCIYILGDVSDWIQNAYQFSVAEGNFYSSLKLPPKEQSDSLVNFRIENK
ncbi:ABC transporter ATP-binding protein [Pontibacter burrus]|uniref:ABC transporter ATP-binding protein n=1 Tax=Pontibacter burrus TaxID=2704466 RepID=A0A6B3LZR0_9BACT|nr:ABC transporter ATP-binding protein [Pontibacter burrus]NEM98897.1 ABC transporter ATP-binding protein [Pontibacter burrus]